MNHPSISVFYAFARSGGTLLHRCLGCHTQNAILSEINPFVSVSPIKRQAIEWLKLITEETFLEIQDASYIDTLSFLAEKASQQDKKLIIRDWPTVNFLDYLKKAYRPASQLLEQDIYLGHTGMKVRSIVITRKSRQVYLSLTQTFKRLKAIDITYFAQRYLAYAKQVAHFPCFHLEDFWQNPKEQLKKICRTLDVFYDDDFAKSFYHFDKCSGNVNVPSNTDKLTAISPQLYPTDKLHLTPQEETLLDQADTILGYENQ